MVLAVDQLQRGLFVLALSIIPLASSYAEFRWSMPIANWLRQHAPATKRQKLYYYGTDDEPKDFMVRMSATMLGSLGVMLAVIGIVAIATA